MQFLFAEPAAKALDPTEKSIQQYTFNLEK